MKFKLDTVVEMEKHHCLNCDFRIENCDTCIFQPHDYFCSWEDQLVNCPLKLIKDGE